MSSELRELFQRDLEQLPLPPASTWTQRRPHRQPRGIGLAAGALIVALVIVVSLTGGQLLRVARDRIEALRASTNGLVAGNDLIYVADGDPASQGLQVIAMPTGLAIGRFDAATYVGTRQEGGLMSLAGDVAFLPVARQTAPGSDVYETGLQQIDLRRGTALARFNMGTVSRASDLPGTSPFAAATATSSDGRFVWLVRDTGERGQVAQVYRFDVQAFPAAGPAARTDLTTARGGTIRSRVIAVGTDKVIVMREEYVEAFSSINRVAADWYVLDAQLNVVKAFEGDVTRLPVSGRCSTDVLADPTGSGWLVMCSDPSGAADGALLFLDGQTFEITGRVTLDRAWGVAMTMSMASDGRLYVLTNRPLVARIDPRARTRIDARPVTSARAWFDDLLPPVAAAKNVGGRALISPDGRYAYIADMPERWGALATIDLAAATVVARSNEFATVIALGLSGQGERLYALTADSAGARAIVLLEPRSLSIAARSDVVPNSLAIAAVRNDAR
jgi:hypothetical protein